MGGLRLRTKFLLSMVAVSAASHDSLLFWLVRHTVQQQVRVEIQRDLQNSVSAFHNFQEQREETLERSAALLADLPNVRAHDDHSRRGYYPGCIPGVCGIWPAATCFCSPILGQSDGASGDPQEITVPEATGVFPKVVSQEETRHWWYVEGHLYEVFLAGHLFWSRRAGTRYWDIWCWV